MQSELRALLRAQLIEKTNELTGKLRALLQELNPSPAVEQLALMVCLEAVIEAMPARMQAASIESMRSLVGSLEEKLQRQNPAFAQASEHIH